MQHWARCVLGKWRRFYSVSAGGVDDLLKSSLWAAARVWVEIQNEVAAFGRVGLLWGLFWVASDPGQGP